MKPLEQAVEDLNLIGADLATLDPRAVHAEVIYFRGSKLKAWSAKEAPPARSTEPPMLLPDKLDKWVERTERLYFGAIAAIREAAENAARYQAQLTARLSQKDARELAEAEAGEKVGTCVVCACLVDKTKGERLLEGRCYADYVYRREHDGRDAPQSVLDARLEHAVQAAAAAKVPGARR